MLEASHSFASATTKAAKPEEIESLTVTVRYRAGPLEGLRQSSQFGQKASLKARHKLDSQKPIQSSPEQHFAEPLEAPLSTEQKLRKMSGAQCAELLQTPDPPTYAPPCRHPARVMSYLLRAYIEAEQLGLTVAVLTRTASRLVTGSAGSGMGTAHEQAASIPVGMLGLPNGLDTTVKCPSVPVPTAEVNSTAHPAACCLPQCPSWPANYLDLPLTTGLDSA